MHKPLISSFYILLLLTTGLTIRQAFAGRGPAVEPITEVSIEENHTTRSPGQVETGFDFSNNKTAQPRASANIGIKAKNPTYSLLGPLIFLFALPLALWIIVFKKMQTPPADKKINYYSKTFQLKSTKLKNQETDKDEDNEDDEQNYPKAS